MSEPEKYTLPLVLNIMRGHANAIGNAAEALRGTCGTDPEILAMVGERALKAGEFIRAVENVRGVQGHDVPPPAVPFAMLDLQPLVVPGAEAS